MKIKKIQLKPNYVLIESESEDSNGNNKYITWKSEVPPLETFRKVFRSLNNYVSILLGITGEENIIVETLNIGYKDDMMKLVISCKKMLDEGTAPFCFNTPLRFINNSNENVNVPPQVAQLIDETIEHAKEFMKTEYQLNLFNKEAA